MLLLLTQPRSVVGEKWLLLLAFLVNVFEVVDTRQATGRRQACVMSRVNTGAGLMLLWFHVVSVFRNIISMRKSLFPPSSLSLLHEVFFEIPIIVFNALFTLEKESLAEG